MSDPYPDGALPLHREGRKASWFELFFDLVFVVAVAQLSGYWSHHFDLAHALGFAFVFLVFWWCWPPASAANAVQKVWVVRALGCMGGLSKGGASK